MSTLSTKIASLVFPGLTWKFPSRNKELFLTFDDGPHPVVTPKVLNILDEYKAKATFFCVGENVQKHPETYARILERGHRTGNHTFNHLKGWKTEKTEYLDNIRKCDELIDSRLFRPPHGRITSKQARMVVSSGYQIIMWSVLTKDYRQNGNREKLLQKAIRHTKPGSVVVFHDSEKAAENMLWMLPGFLAYFSEKGFVFKVVD
jgi:peptidoglycan/xylan/chitin deacetylase (PgdA/CDA1 family)